MHFARAHAVRSPHAVDVVCVLEARRDGVAQGEVILLDEEFVDDIVGVISRDLCQRSDGRRARTSDRVVVVGHALCSRRAGILGGVHLRVGDETLARTE